LINHIILSLSTESVSGASGQSLESKPWRAPHNIQTHLPSPCGVLYSSARSSGWSFPVAWGCGALCPNPKTLNPSPHAGGVVVAAQRGEPGSGGRRPQRRGARGQGLRRRRGAPRRPGILHDRMVNSIPFPSSMLRVGRFLGLV
jgi:hypothetical protein